MYKSRGVFFVFSFVRKFSGVYGRSKQPGFTYALLEGRPLGKNHFVVNMRDHGSWCS
jgi:hypothetical protein